MLQYRELTLEDIPQITALYVAAFNAEPWHEQWTVQTASKRLQQMLQRGSAYGLLAYDEIEICGVILGDEEQFYDGPQFQIREFCVEHNRRGMGIGTKLYKELEQRLQKRGICEIVLCTLRHPATEGFYQKQGLCTNVDMVYMSKKL